MQAEAAVSAHGSYQVLADVLNLTRDMLDHAGAGDWDRVAELERARRDDLQRCFLDPVDADQGELVAEALAVMLHLNEELMGLLAGAREAVLNKGAEQKRTRAAVGQYQDVKSRLTA